MGTLETALYDLVMSDAAVTALVGSAVYPMVIPQEVQTPALAYQVISDVPDYAHDGDVGLRRARVQYTAAAADYGTAKRLLAALHAVLTGYRGVVDGVTVQAVFVENVRDEWAAQFVRPAARLDAVVWYRI